MAATSIHAITSTEVKAIRYITNPDKTENGVYVSNYACSNDTETAAKNFEMVRACGTQRGTVLAQHIYQSFKPGEVSPEEALEIGLKTAEIFLKNQYQYVVSVHTDKSHVHCHIIFNNTNLFNGKSFEYLENRKGLKWKKLREISDQICLEHGLSVIENPEKGKGKSWYEWQQNNKNLSWKSKLKLIIDDCVMRSDNFNDLLNKLELREVETVYSPDKIINLKFKLKGQERYTRSRTLGWYYELPQLIKRIRMYRQPEVKAAPIIDSKSKYSGTRFADIHNMKIASEVINLMSSYGVNTAGELEDLALSEYARRSTLVSELNSLQFRIQEKTEQIENVREYQKFLPYHENYKSQKTDGAKRKYAKKYASELESFASTKADLKRLFSEKTIDGPEELARQRDELIFERNAKNDAYKESKKRSKDMDYCRKVLSDYLRNEHDVQRKKSKGELE